LSTVTLLQEREILEKRKWFLEEYFSGRVNLPCGLKTTVNRFYERKFLLFLAVNRIGDPGCLVSIADQQPVREKSC
jgi:hypothetical protein